MKLSNDLLSKFAKTVDNRNKTKDPILEFNGVISEVNEDGTYNVLLDATVEMGDSDICVCSSQVDIVNLGDRVRVKIQNNDGIIIENYNNPANVFVKTLTISKETQFTKVTAGSGGHVTKGYMHESITSPELEEKLLEGWQITGIDTILYEIRGSFEYSTGGQSEPVTYTYPTWTLPWNDDALINYVAPYINLSVYRYNKTNNNFEIFFTYNGAGTPSGSTNPNVNTMYYKITFDVTISRPGILEPEE